MREDSPNPTSSTVSIGDAARALNLSEKSLRRLADRGDIPSTRTAGGHRRFTLPAVRAALGTIAHTGLTHRGEADWTGDVDLVDLDEAIVWSRIATALSLDPKSEGTRIMNYAFTEMLNNAIDHSGGGQAMVRVWSAPDQLAFEIQDDGVGAYLRLRDGLGLVSVLDAAAELTKGKRTTWPERHTGEGIFFTSKAVTEFRLSANGIRLTIDNQRDDYALGASAVTEGTRVEAALDLPPTTTLREVFQEFTDDDLRFSRSRPRIELFGTGLSFVSRSEARRVLADMTDFDDIDIDFTGVDDVGQGFVDELFRVWPSQNTGVQLHPLNMNDAVAFMVRRGIGVRGKGSLPPDAESG
ncbi:STAS-like domain-containing protein [Microbacterium maritypicum]|uniref:DUF4325 domain-containing protein n=1 Tax=Microbacterium maritypicum MF109 TaxID=1333857 RepID=T5KST0_MICMQ|nr:DUF4325 domain-containing protein [Microbacterium liquefaciens]EQM86728.1 hypothetical protein L687_09185 [Microbacterium maritypicum MF109]